MGSTDQFPEVPRLESLKRALKFVKNPIPSLNEFQAKYGDTYSMYMGGMIKGLMTVEPEIIQQILQRQHRNFEKSELQTKKMGYYLGKGLLTNTGSDWLRQRRLIQPGFHRDRLQNLIHLMMSVIKETSDEIEQESQSGSIPVYDKMLRLSFHIIAKTLFSQHIPDNELNELSDSVSIVQEFIIKQLRLPFLAPWFVVSGDVKKHKNIVDRMRAQLLSYVDHRRSTPGTTNDLLDMLLDARYEDNGEAMSDEQLIDEILILFAAGHETSANALSWVFYLLSQHPAAVEKIREESAAFFDQEITLSSLKDLSYTTRVIQETMRLYPPAWITDRIALDDCTLDGKKFSKGETAVIFIYGLHHNPKFWDNPEAFDPDRFLPENSKDRAAYAYLPFGGGPRLCIGNSFSMMEMQLAVAYLVQHFDFELENKSPVELWPMITLRPKTTIPMRWKKRS